MAKASPSKLLLATSIRRATHIRQMGPIDALIRRTRPIAVVDTTGDQISRHLLILATTSSTFVSHLLTPSMLGYVPLHGDHLTLILGGCTTQISDTP